MKAAALLILLCSALPASAFAQTAAGSAGQPQTATAQQGQGAAPIPVMRGNWSLKAPKKKRPGQGTARAAQQTAKQDVEGPTVPPPMRQRVPQAKRKQPAPERQSNHVNATPMVASILAKNKRN